jgi:23S rRNA pseudouridine1911/1915/1917 synthase
VTAPPPDRRAFVVSPDLRGLRLDVALARLAPDLSRARVQRLVGEDRVRLEGRPARASTRLRGGERIDVEVPPPEPSRLEAQDLPLAVLHEDDRILVLDKAAGMVVHPARGSPRSTVVNALLHHLSGGRGEAASPAPGQPPPAAPPLAGRLPRLGLVHRLDKDTSGCLVVAKDEAALAALQAAFRGRSVEKTYLALCHGPLAAEGRIDTPYGRHPRDRKRFTGRVRAARRAVTEWTVRERFGERAALAEVRLLTGRTHQIRVHLSESGHPLVADPVYGGTRREARLPEGDPARRAAGAIGRQALHAWKLAFDHPAGGRVAFTAPVPPDLLRALAVLRGR